MKNIVLFLLVFIGINVWGQSDGLNPTTGLKKGSGTSLDFLGTDTIVGSSTNGRFINKNFGVEWGRYWNNYKGSLGLSIPNTRVAFGNGSGLSSDAAFTYSSSVLSVPRILGGYGSAINPTLKYGNAGIFDGGNGTTFSFLNADIAHIGYSSNYGTQSALVLKGDNPSIELKGSVNSYGVNIKFFGAYAGESALGGAYAMIDGNGGLRLRTSSGTSIGLEKVGVTENQAFLYASITSNLVNSSGGIGSATSFDAKYNNLNFITTPHKSLVTNDYLGGVIFSAFSPSHGQAPRGSINMRYVGSDIHNDFRNEICFNIHSTGSGGYSYAFIERMKIKDNGNILNNGLFEYDYSSIVPSLGTDKWIYAYNWNTNKLGFQVNPTLYNVDGTLTGTRVINNGGYNISILGTGNLGVGISPTEKIDILGNMKLSGNVIMNGSRGTPKYIYANNTADDGSIKIRAGTTAGYFSEISVDGWDGTGTASNINFKTGGSDRVNIRNGGQLKIMTQGTASLPQLGLTADNTGLNGSSSLIDFNINGVKRGILDINNDLTLGTGVSGEFYASTYYKVWNGSALESYRVLGYGGQGLWNYAPSGRGYKWIEGANDLMIVSNGVYQLNTAPTVTTNNYVWTVGANSTLQKQDFSTLVNQNTSSDTFAITGVNSSITVSGQAESIDLNFYINGIDSVTFNLSQPLRDAQRVSITTNKMVLMGGNEGFIFKYGGVEQFRIMNDPTDIFNFDYEFAQVNPRFSCVIQYVKKRNVWRMLSYQVK